MKRILTLLLTILLVATTLSAQNSKLLKTAKAEAKEYKKDGWQTIDGEPSLEQQVAKLLEYQISIDDAGEPKYYIVTSIATKESYSKALREATNGCYMNICSELYPKGMNIIYVNGEAVSSSFTPPTGFKLAPEIPLLNIYRPKDGKVEVLVSYAFNRKQCIVSQQ